jgi:uncharacterized repeat protein (TIGR03803 family)
MKTRVKNFLLLPVLLAALGLLPARPAAAQTFTTLHSFTNNPDGATPVAGLVLSGNTLYGTTAGGGNAGNGTVFAVNVNGLGYTNLYRFTGGSDGATPRDGLILSGNTLYGTTESGGTNGNGAIFSLNTNGTGFVKLYSFTGYTGFFPSVNSDGANPYAGLILSGSTLYGTAFNGGTNGFGTVFAINTDGTGFTNIYNFTAGNNGTVPHDGGAPFGGVILLGNTLYGTTQGGGLGSGVVFSVKTNGTGIVPLHVFTSPPSDGQLPEAGLASSGNTLYGTAFGGGRSSAGMLFAVNTDGSGYTNLYSFTAVNPSTGTNIDGTGPSAGLILSGGTLYGTARYNGFLRDGTVFAVSTNGTAFTNLYNFSGGSDGAYPMAGLTLSGTTLYGTTSSGGSAGDGTVFSLSLLPVNAQQLTIHLSGTNAVLTWSAGATGYTLGFATNLVPPIAWNTNLPAPAVINGNNTVTNPISGTQKFYRLSQ